MINRVDRINEDYYIIAIELNNDEFYWTKTGEANWVWSLYATAWEFKDLDDAEKMINKIFDLHTQVKINKPEVYPEEFKFTKISMFEKCPDYFGNYKILHIVNKVEEEE